MGFESLKASARKHAGCKECSFIQAFPLTHYISSPAAEVEEESEPGYTDHADKVVIRTTEED